MTVVPLKKRRKPAGQAELQSGDRVIWLRRRRSGARRPTAVLVTLVALGEETAIVSRIRRGKVLTETISRKNLRVF